MTHTVIKVPDYVTMIEPAEHRDMTGLAEVLVALLTKDATLPQPCYLSMSEAGQSISLQFTGDPGTFHAMARWAERFGGTLTGERRPREDGTAQVRCDVRFSYLGIRVELYAYVTTSPEKEGS